MQSIEGLARHVDPKLHEGLATWQWLAPGEHSLLIVFFTWIIKPLY